MNKECRFMNHVAFPYYKHSAIGVDRFGKTCYWYSFFFWERLYAYSPRWV